MKASRETIDYDESNARYINKCNRIIRYREKLVGSLLEISKSLMQTFAREEGR